MKIQCSKNEQANTLDIGADLPGGKAEVHIPTGKRDLLHYASIAAAGALWLHGAKSRKERTRTLARAERSLGGLGKTKKRRGKFGKKK